MLSASALLLFALTEPATADTIMRIIGDRTPAIPHTVGGQAAVEAPPTSIGDKTFIRIIGDKQSTVREPVRKQAVRPAPSSPSAEEEGRKVAEEVEQDRLAQIKGEQEDEAALQAAIARLEAARAALIENCRQEAETQAKLKKITPSKQAGRRHKGVKKRHRKCLKYSTR